MGESFKHRSEQHMFSGSAVAIMVTMTKNIIDLEMPAASKIFFFASFFHIHENFLLLFSKAVFVGFVITLIYFCMHC